MFQGEQEAIIGRDVAQMVSALSRTDWRRGGIPRIVLDLSTMGTWLRCRCNSVPDQTGEEGEEDPG